jgi:alkyl hydroperoxide reductase subunit AhpC
MLTVGDRFPEYKTKACVGNGNDDLTEINAGTYEGKWKLFLFYPKDFTFVCPTELVEFGKRKGDFDDRDVVLLGASTDNEFSHLAWRRSHEDLKELPYPLLAAQKLARELGVLDRQEDVCLRASFLVDPEGVIQWVTVNNLSVGRSVDEAIRVIDAVQSDELCPCNWKKGDAYLEV